MKNVRVNVKSVSVVVIVSALSVKNIFIVVCVLNKKK